MAGPPTFKPRIAYVVSRFPHLSESFILRELDELERQGFEVVLCPLLHHREPVSHPAAKRWMERAWYTPFISRRLVRDALWQLRRRPARSLLTVAEALLRVVRSRNFFVGTLGITLKTFHLARRLEEAGVQHVHAHFATHPAMAAWMIRRLSGIGYSVTVHAHDLYVRTDMLREKMAGARFVVTISEFNRALLARFGDPSKIAVVRCGVALENYPTQASVPAGPFTILTVASLQEYKGIEYLIRACALLRGRGRDGFRCLVVGEGPLHAELDRLVDAHGLRGRVELCGPRPEQDVARLLREAHVFVLPSVVAANGQMEGLPVVLVEALAVGVPVVAADLSAIPEIVTPETGGRLVQPRDPEALASALAEVMDDPEGARRQAAGGRALVEREFSLTANVAVLADLFRRFAASEGPA